MRFVSRLEAYRNASTDPKVYLDPDLAVVPDEILGTFGDGMPHQPCFREAVRPSGEVGWIGVSLLPDGTIAVGSRVVEFVWVGVEGMDTYRHVVVPALAGREHPHPAVAEALLNSKGLPAAYHEKTFVFWSHHWGVGAALFHKPLAVVVDLNGFANAVLASTFFGVSGGIWVAVFRQ